MATTSTTTKHLLQHPSHDHPLELRDLSNAWFRPFCLLCHRKIWAKDYVCQEGCEAYVCQEGCETYYYHKVCVEAPSQIDRHPLHPDHPLPLIHDQRAFWCDACDEDFDSGGSSFRCYECDFNLDIYCALSTLSDEGGSQGGTTSQLITLPLHPHTLTSFSSRHGFFGDSDCYICEGNVEGDGYTCLRRSCEFFIHEGCIQDLYYADGTKAPRVYHGHPLEIFVGEDTGSRRCASCGSDKSGEFIGCSSCEVFYHRHCFQVPEVLRYPSHNSDHTLVLFLDIGTLQRCRSCSIYLEDDIYYRCTSCKFFVHVGCVFQVLTYCEEGMSAKIELSWHKHPLLLCHRTKSASNVCFYCKHQLIGPTYVCKERDCGFLLHKQCMEIESTITHPHHPDHPLTLWECNYDDSHFCKACGVTTHRGLRFSCKSCFAVDLHVKCAARFPTHKHYLHEHKLVRLEGHRDVECLEMNVKPYYELDQDEEGFEDSQYWECNRCRTSNDSTVFRCVPCNFNLHEECMELPKVMRNDKIHWHLLTLHETFVEDDSGKYYCEHCEKTRDPRLGVYVCEYCKISLPRIYHIHCVLTEFEKLFTEKHQLSAVVKLRKEIANKKEEVQATKEKLKEAKEVKHKLKEELDDLEEELDDLKEELEEATQRTTRPGNE